MRRTIFVISIVLILASPGFAVVIAPPWDDWITQEPGYVIQVMPPDDVLVVTPDEPGFAFALTNNNMYQYLSLLPGLSFEMDVTWIASEWSGTNIWARWSTLAINSNPGWWQTDPYTPGPQPLPWPDWDPYNWGEVHTRTLSYDLSGYNWAGVQDAYWLQFNIALNFDGDPGFTWGNFYVNEIRIIVPEPATIAMLGIGALALLRRKR